MIFRPELAAAVMAGTKTVTRRLGSDNPRSPWYRERCSLVPGQSYAVCPGRGKHAIGRVRIVSVRSEQVKAALWEPHREGFVSRQAFIDAWTAINGMWDPLAYVWRVEFVVAEMIGVQGSPPVGVAKVVFIGSEETVQGYGDLISQSAAGAIRASRR